MHSPQGSTRTYAAENPAVPLTRIRFGVTVSASHPDTRNPKREIVYRDGATEPGNAFLRTERDGNKRQLTLQVRRHTKFFES